MKTDDEIKAIDRALSAIESQVQDMSDEMSSKLGTMNSLIQ